MKNKIIFFTVGLAVFSVMGCSHSGDEHPPAHERPITGTLTSNIDELSKNEYAEACDKTLAPIKHELAAFLDVHQKEISAGSKNYSNNSYYRVIPLGNTFVREVINTTPEHKGWYTFDEDWRLVYDRYLKIKDSPLSSEWINIDSMVRFLISDDQDRILYNSNPYLDYASGDNLLALRDAVTACYLSEKCVSLNLNPTLQKFALDQPYFRVYIDELSAETDLSEKRGIIDRFLNKRLKVDAKNYEFQTNSGVSRPSDSQLSLALTAGNLAGNEDVLAGIIEPLWKSADLQLKVNWTDFSILKGAFKFIMGDVPNDRANVQTSTRSINLFPNVRTRSIAHEIGHVLGFPDHYYTVWNPGACKYQLQANDEDFMSQSDTGTVTADEWATLKRYYPRK